MNKIYTKTGDKGKTSLLKGKRVLKSDPQVQAYGTIDELNSSIGLVISKIKQEQEFKYKIDIIKKLEILQKNLMLIGSSLASLNSDLNKKFILKKYEIENLEKHIDYMEKQLPELKNFILPGGSEISSIIQLSRSICRRAERKTVELNTIKQIDNKILIYLNRLSDWFFVLARFINFQKNIKETKWMI